LGSDADRRYFLEGDPVQSMFIYAMSVLNIIDLVRLVIMDRACGIYLEERVHISGEETRLDYWISYEKLMSDHDLVTKSSVLAGVC
jgi:hypothetical protein